MRILSEDRQNNFAGEQSGNPPDRERQVSPDEMRALAARLDRPAIELEISEGDARAVPAYERTRSRATQKAIRDRAITQQAWKGHTNAQIARRFKISEKPAQVHHRGRSEAKR